MIFFIASLLLTFLLTAFVSGNNLSAAVGTLIGSRIVSRHAGIIIGSSGFLLGLLLEGRFLKGAAISLAHALDDLLDDCEDISDLVFTIMLSVAN